MPPCAEHPLILPCWVKPLGRSFVASSTTSSNCLAWYPSPDLSPRLTDPRNLHLPFRKEILAIVGALVMDAAPASEPNGRNIKFRREGLTLWLRVLALLSQREAESIETASELWPPALRRRLNSALDQHERGSSRSSPFRSTFFRPGLKYINRFEFRDFSAARQRPRTCSRRPAARTTTRSIALWLSWRPSQPSPSKAEAGLEMWHLHCSPRRFARDSLMPKQRPRTVGGSNQRSLTICFT